MVYGWSCRLEDRVVHRLFLAWMNPNFLLVWIANIKYTSGRYKSSEFLVSPKPTDWSSHCSSKFLCLTPWGGGVGSNGFPFKWECRMGCNLPVFLGSPAWPAHMGSEFVSPALLDEINVVQCVWGRILNALNICGNLTFVNIYLFFKSPEVSGETYSCLYNK